MSSGGGLGKATVILFCLYASLSVAGLLLLKANLAAAVTSLRTPGPADVRHVALAAAGATAYAVSFALWLIVLTRIPLARAYPLAVGTTLALTALGAKILLAEPYTLRHLAGTTAVFLGVVLLATGPGD